MPNEDFRIKTGVDVDDSGVGQLHSIAEELKKTADSLKAINSVKFNGDIFSGLANAGKNIQNVTKNIDKLQKSATNAGKPLSNIGKGAENITSENSKQFTLLDLASIDVIKSNMEEITTSAQNLKEALGSEVTSGLMTQINEMLSKKDELQNLANILKSNKEEISNAGKVAGKASGTPKDTTSKYITDRYKRLSEIEPEYQRLSSPLVENTEEENNRLKTLQQERSTLLHELNSQMSEIRKASDNSEIGKARTSYLNAKNNIASNFKGDVVNDVYTKLAVASDRSFEGSGQVISTLTANINSLTDAFNNGEISAEKYASSTQELFNGFSNTVAQIEPGNIEKATAAMENYLNAQMKAKESVKGNFSRTEKENTVTMVGEFENDLGQLRKIQVQADTVKGEVKKISEVISQVKKSSSSSGTPKYTTDKSYTGNLNYLANTEAESQVIERYISNTKRLETAINERKAVEEKVKTKSPQNSTEQNAADKYQNVQSNVTKNLDQYDEQIKKAYNDLNALQQAKSGIQGIDKLFESGEKDITKWAAALANGKMSIETFESKVSGLKTSIGNVGKIIDPASITDAKAELESYIREITGLQDINFKNYSLKNGIATATGEWVNKSTGEVQTLNAQLNTTNGIMQTLSTSIKPMESGLSQFFSSWKDGMAKIGKYIGTYRLVMQAWSAFKSGVQQVIDFDSALAEMRKVSTESVSSLKQLQKESFGLADGVGTTALQIQKSTADFLRLGENFNEAKQSAVNANKLLTISEFNNIDDATSALVSMKAAYSDLSEDQIIDKINAVGDNYAISTDQVSTGLQKAGATLSLLGNNIDEAAALITAANTTLQNVDTVSAGVRTISLRIMGCLKLPKHTVMYGCI